MLGTCGDLSRKEIASRLSLTPAGVTKICAELIEEGFIEEKGVVSEQGKSGRKEILLTLRLKDKLVLGINAEKDLLIFSLSNLAGELLCSKRTSLSSNVDLVIDESRKFLYNLKEDRSKIIAAGVCTIGSNDENGFSIWRDENLRQKFEDALSLPVVTENNVKAFAESELIYGRLRNSDSVLFLKWGPGLGSSIVANGRVCSGNDSGVAEIGHYIVNPGGVKCRCGRFGCLETETSSDIIINGIGHNLTLDEIINSDDSDIVSFLEHKIDLVALALTNTATILNTDTIVLFGTMFNNELIAQKLKKQCMRYNSNFSDDMINLSSLNSRREYIGSTAICAKHYFFEREG